ncbi:3714_t:CDS:2, partial [Cetraspora pellucida]
IYTEHQDQQLLCIELVPDNRNKKVLSKREATRLSNTLLIDAKAFDTKLNIQNKKNENQSQNFEQKSTDTQENSAQRDLTDAT